jgi:outer membrane protein OmpA-like peptidoglycan-associated protein
MNRLLILSVLVMSLLFTVQINAQNTRVIKDVVLLNIEPYEVLMNDKGDIIAKVRHLPDYLKSSDDYKGEKVNTEVAQREGKRDIPGGISDVAVKPMEEKQVQANVGEEVEYQPTVIKANGHFEVNFAKGTATLNNKAIATLNELAQVLQQYPEKKIQVFGFKNEPAIVASLLSKRRQDACIAYLRIKGVDIDRQVRKGSVTEGASNKIVFGFE